MTKNTDYDADTTEFKNQSLVIDNTLESLRIQGSILLRETYAAPWGIRIPNQSQLAHALNVNDNSRVVAFHMVEFGHCIIKTKDSGVVQLKAGEILICFSGVAHQLYQGKVRKYYSVESLLAGSANLQQPKTPATTENASLLCGVFILNNTPFNPLLNALPAILHTGLSRAGELHNLSGVARLLTEEIDKKAPGSQYIAQRLLEVLCAEAIRSHIEHQPSQEQNWFQAIKDPVIGKAIAAIHNRPGFNWSVKSLAEHVAMSPSRFAARFSDCLGDSPIAYISKWRMNLACQTLIETKESIDQIAAKAGYENQAAFSRAFKKHIGISPVAWRSQRTAPKS